MAGEAPVVPRQQLLLVERGEVAEHATADEPRAAEPDEGDPEALGGERAAAHRAPGLASRQEAVARHVPRLEGDPVLAPRRRVELAVGQPPAGAVPVLAEPVILVEARHEVVGEPDAQPRRDALVPEDAAHEQRVVAARADEPPLGRARRGERAPVAREDAAEQLAHRAALGVVPAAGVGRHAAPRDEHGVEDEPGDGLDHRRRAGRQGGEEGRELGRLRPPALECVVPRVVHPGLVAPADGAVAAAYNAGTGKASRPATPPRLTGPGRPA